jgi:aspartyl-tRNA(Asn)/glutamyl-tRNA(Gln) amidotransferase subunit C
MSISRHDVENAAHLARIAISEDTIATTTERLANVLHMVDQLQAVDTRGIEALAHPLETTQRLRPDQVTESNQRDQLMKNAPATEAGLFLVPKVIE